MATPLTMKTASNGFLLCCYHRFYFDTMFCFLDASRNQSFLLFQPHADTLEIRNKVHSMLSQKGIDIVGSGEIALSEVIGGMDVVDEHFKEIAKNATEFIPAVAQLSDQQKLAFSNFYSESWDLAVERGAILSASDFCTQFAVTTQDITAKWNTCLEENKLLVMHETLQICVFDTKINEGPVYCVNGFYLGLRESYLNSVVHFFLLEFDELSISWSEFNHDIVGSVSPAEAGKFSIRGQLLQKQIESNIRASNPNCVHNFIHVSLSSFQSLADKMNWLKLSIDADPFGRHLLKIGISKDAISYLASNPVIAGASVFSHVEETGFSACVQILQNLTRNLS